MLSVTKAIWTGLSAPGGCWCFAYPLGKCGPREIIDAAANHEFALIRGAKGWQVLENTARRKIEREFKKFASLAGNSSEFIGICGMDFVPSYINEAGLRMVGLDDLAQLRQASIRALFFLEDQKFLRDEFLPRVHAEGRANHVAILAANVQAMPAQDVGAILDRDFGIAVRAGLHCAPFAHRRLGTIECGAVRFSPGVFNTEEEIDRVIDAMSVISH